MTRAGTCRGRRRPTRAGRGTVSSRQTTVPPGRTTRRSSRNPLSKSGEVAQAERDRRSVELGVACREREGVAGDELELDHVAVASRRRARPSPAERSTPSTRPNGPTRSASAAASLPVPQATSIAEPALATPVAATAAVAPAPVRAEGHDRVQAVVDGRDLVEHGRDVGLGHGVPGPGPRTPADAQCRPSGAERSRPRRRRCRVAARRGGASSAGVRCAEGVRFARERALPPAPLPADPRSRPQGRSPRRPPSAVGRLFDPFCARGPTAQGKSGTALDGAGPDLEHRPRAPDRRPSPGCRCRRG